MTYKNKGSYESSPPCIQALEGLDRTLKIVTIFEFRNYPDAYLSKPANLRFTHTTSADIRMSRVGHMNGLYQMYEWVVCWIYQWGIYMKEARQICDWGYIWLGHITNMNEARQT